MKKPKHLKIVPASPQTKDVAQGQNPPEYKLRVFRPDCNQPGRASDILPSIAQRPQDESAAPAAAPNANPVPNPRACKLTTVEKLKQLHKRVSNGRLPPRQEFWRGAHLMICTPGSAPDLASQRPEYADAFPPPDDVLVHPDALAIGAALAMVIRCIANDPRGIYSYATKHQMIRIFLKDLPYQNAAAAMIQNAIHLWAFFDWATEGIETGELSAELVGELSDGAAAASGGDPEDFNPGNC